jgi:hypothetical protein
VWGLRGQYQPSTARHENLFRCLSIEGVPGPLRPQESCYSVGQTPVSVEHGFREHPFAQAQEIALSSYSESGTESGSDPEYHPSRFGGESGRSPRKIATEKAGCRKGDDEDAEAAATKPRPLLSSPRNPRRGRSRRTRHRRRDPERHPRDRTTGTERIGLAPHRPSRARRPRLQKSLNSH